MSADSPKRYRSGPRDEMPTAATMLLLQMRFDLLHRRTRRSAYDVPPEAAPAASRPEMSVSCDAKSLRGCAIRASPTLDGAALAGWLPTTTEASVAVAPLREGQAFDALLTLLGCELTGNFRVVLPHEPSHYRKKVRHAEWFREDSVR